MKYYIVCPIKKDTEYLQGKMGNAAWKKTKAEGTTYTLEEANKMMEFYRWNVPDTRVRIALDEDSVDIEYNPSKRAIK